MVDLLGMFRRRARKRGPQGFARSHPDITALADSVGGMLTQPVRDAPPIARDAVRETPPLLRREAPVAEKPRPRSAGNGAAAPRFATKAGYLAVHSVEKSFGSRQVVRGVSIYVRRGE
ncbi:MAG: lipopolysaccharide export system ATP-binding protein, partial [Bradyrhizobium sp.]|nr:lipopolysaccharide export system ATP-binding protein [Bradyrhizobium sp.]